MSLPIAGRRHRPASRRTAHLTPQSALIVLVAPAVATRLDLYDRRCAPWTATPSTRSTYKTPGPRFPPRSRPHRTLRGSLSPITATRSRRSQGPAQTKSEGGLRCSRDLRSCVLVDPGQKLVVARRRMLSSNVLLGARTQPRRQVSVGGEPLHGGGQSQMRAGSTINPVSSFRMNSGGPPRSVTTIAFARACASRMINGPLSSYRDGRTTARPDVEFRVQLGS